MYKQIAKLTFATFIWKKYSHLILSTLLLFAYLYLVGKIHTDTLNYLKLENNGQGVGQSFIYKWLAMITGVLIYFLFNHLVHKKKHTKIKKQSDKKNKTDPFKDLRHDKPLRSKADMIIERNKK